MNDRMRGALVVALIAIVITGAGAAADIDGVVRGGLVVLAVAVISLAAGVAQGMSRPEDPPRERWRR